MDYQLQQQTELAYAYKNKKTEFFNALVLSTPESIVLKVAHKQCPRGHVLGIIKLFSMEEDFCPVHNCKMNKDDLEITKIEMYNFFIKISNDDKLQVFIYAGEYGSQKIEIHNKISLKGFPIVISTKGKGVFAKGLLIDSSKELEIAKEKIAGKPKIKKEDVIKQLLSNRPRLNYSDDVWDTYKHALLLTLVHVGLNEMVIGNPGTLKSELALQLQKLSGCAYLEVPNSSEIALCGATIRDSNGYHFEGGLIFDAKDNVMILDEVEKMENYSYLRHLNGVLANGHFTYRKADIKIDRDDFKVSFIGMGNPKSTWFTTIPKVEIQNTFPRNREFLNRMHLIWGLQGKAPDISNMTEPDFESMRNYINYAKQIVITERDITVQARKRMADFYKKNMYIDERFYKKLVDLCIAEAKFSLHSRVEIEDVLQVEHFFEIQNQLLNTNR